MMIFFATLGIAAFLDHAAPASGILGGIALLILSRALGDCAVATSSCLQALRKLEEKT